MNKSFTHVIGLMSGTSLDGLDLVYVKFDKQQVQNFEIIYSETKSYSKKWQQQLAAAIHFSKSDLDELDIQYGQLLAEYVNDFINEHQIEKIDFIASHGHTILHQPAKGITLQIGNGQVLTDATKVKVVCDFRTQDVALGGQGAPLVPIGDELLFNQYSSCVNLGGFANISFNQNNERIAFDICPINIVLNHYVKKMNLPFDDKGMIASSGAVNEDLLNTLNALEYYHKKPPKSLGLEWVQEYIFPIINTYKLSIKDVLRTFTEHVAVQIARILSGKKNVFITGGGAYNTYLIGRVNALSEANIVIPNDQLIEYKEALIFALIGVLKLDNQVNCLQSVTGAKKNHSSGKIFTPNFS
ncbi:MAG: anhydro-N-acetylmuramic acid kinase [Flavobacteriaceae bacterium]|nr:anhydro-N-acetylmuramic acid kinase [Flavobacteriaceae bacterium]